MAKKSILGIDIGSDRLKLAFVEDNYVLDAVSVKMPDNLYKEGRWTSMETMSGLISSTMKDNGIKATQAALVIPNENVYIKNVRMPMMTAEQLTYNLPFEFNDYITGEIKDYVFDYAVLPNDDGGEEQPAEGEGASEEVKEEKEETLNLMAVSAERALIDEATEMLRKAGLRLVKAAPSICAYISLIRGQMDALKQTTDEFCILDLGYEATRMYVFKEDRHETTRMIETGLSTLVNVIADLYSVDNHIAYTYIMNDFENCLERDESREAYDNIAVELMRVMNFYRFSNPDSVLSDMWMCGGGARILPLCDAIGSMLDMRLHTASELVTDGDDIPDCNSFVQAIGIACD